MLNCRFFVLELKRFSNYAKNISVLIQLISFIYELASFTVVGKNFVKVHVGLPTNFYHMKITCYTVPKVVDCYFTSVKIQNRKMGKRPISKSTANRCVHALQLYKRLASQLSEKWKQPYGPTPRCDG